MDFLPGSLEQVPESIELGIGFQRIEVTAFGIHEFLDETWEKAVSPSSPVEAK